MESLSQTARALGETGDPLPASYQAFERERIAFRRGQVSLIVAGPGTGKSTLALDVCRRLAPHTALYFCIDTDPADMASRATAAVTGYPLSEIEHDLEYFTEDVREHMGHVRWCFDGGPTVDDVADEVECYGAVFGAYPEMVVIDNLTSLDMDGGISYSTVQDTISRLNSCARKTGAHVMVLHHATGEYEDGTRTIPQSGVEYKAAKRVALLLTLTRMGASLRVHVCKNRGGKASATGHLWVQLAADLEKMRINDTEGTAA